MCTLVASWGHLGPSWAHRGAILGPSWDHLPVREHRCNPLISLYFPLRSVSDVLQARCSPRPAPPSPLRGTGREVPSGRNGARGASRTTPGASLSGLWTYRRCGSETLARTPPLASSMIASPLIRRRAWSSLRTATCRTTGGCGAPSLEGMWSSWTSTSVPLGGFGRRRRAWPLFAVGMRTSGSWARRSAKGKAGGAATTAPTTSSSAATRDSFEWQRRSRRRPIPSLWPRRSCGLSCLDSRASVPSRRSRDGLSHSCTGATRGVPLSCDWCRPRWEWCREFDYVRDVHCCRARSTLRDTSTAVPAPPGPLLARRS